MSTKTGSASPPKAATSSPTMSKEMVTSTHRKNDLKKDKPACEKAKTTTSKSMFDDVDGKNGTGGDVEMVDTTFEGIAEIDGLQHFVCQGFKIPQVPKPLIITRSLGDLFACIESGHIILDPEYQREVVWDDGRSSLLITSLLMGYFIPPIIFNIKKDLTTKNGKRKAVLTRVCVDGKQRLTSVQKFMTGQIGFFDSNSPQKKWYYCHPQVNGREILSNHNILPKAVRAHFLEQSFCCYEYKELKVETEETMFQLVQRGIVLSQAEKMRAMSTEWATFTKQYEDDYNLIVNLSKQTRASGFRLVLTIFTMVQEVMRLTNRQRRSSAPTLQANPTALLRLLEDEKPISNALKNRFKLIFDKFEHLIKLCSDQITATRFKIKANSPFDPAPDFLRKPETDHGKTFSPLELVATAVLVACHMKHRTDEELIEDVKAFRIYIRTKRQDLRLNAQCWVSVWGFIDVEMRERRGLPAEEQSADQQMEIGDEGGGDGEFEDWGRPGSSGSSLTSAESTPEPSSPSNVGDDSDNDDMDEDNSPLPATISRKSPVDRPRRRLNNGNAKRIEDAIEEPENSIEESIEPIETDDLKATVSEVAKDIITKERSESSPAYENAQPPKTKDEVKTTTVTESSKTVPLDEPLATNKVGNKNTVPVMMNKSTTPVMNTQPQEQLKGKIEAPSDDLKGKAIATNEKSKSPTVTDEQREIPKDTKPAAPTAPNGKDSNTQPNKTSENPFVDSLVASIGAVKRPRPASRKAPAPKKPRKG